MDNSLPNQLETLNLNSTDEQAKDVATSIEETFGKEEYLVKTIEWKDKLVQIITQNENGPCPLVAICNVLFLRGDLEIRPPDRETVTFEYLVDRLGDYLLNHTPSEDTAKKSKAPLERQTTSEFVLTYRHHLDTALHILPHLQRGLDVNVRFDDIHGFESTAELAMFDLFQVDLVHGWVVDPQDTETYRVLHKSISYNQAVEKIVQANELTNTSPAEEQKMHEGFIASEFLKETATQLTYYGLSLLLDSIPQDSLCVLFRNNHFSTLYRHPTSGLYMLVTDAGLVSERSVVWESLNDIDQGSSAFFNSQFIKPQLEAKSEFIPSDLDYAIAVSMQPQFQEPKPDNNRSSQISHRANQSHKKHLCIIT